MLDCKKLKAEDITSWHGDVFDHPEYKYICTASGREVIPCIHCNGKRCRNYDNKTETQG